MKRGERRPKIVADIGDKLPPELLLLLQLPELLCDPICHELKCTGETGDFIVASR
jgi:hypothetical protein